MIQIALESFASGSGEAVFGLGQAPVEGFGADDVVGFFEAAGMHAEVAVGGLEKRLQFIECQRTIYGQGADDPETYAFMDQAIEIRRDAFAVWRLYGAKRGGPFTSWVIVANCG